MDHSPVDLDKSPDATSHSKPKKRPRRPERPSLVGALNWHVDAVPFVAVAAFALWHVFNGTAVFHEFWIFVAAFLCLLSIGDIAQAFSARLDDR